MDKLQTNALVRPEYKEAVETWFSALNKQDLEALLDLFAPDPVICNAANPPLHGPTAAADLLNDFFARTSGREFVLLGLAEGDGNVFAHWQGALTFRSGIEIAGYRISEPFTVELRGVDRFSFEDGKVKELDIIHETTSVVRSAQAHAGNK